MIYDNLIHIICDEQEYIFRIFENNFEMYVEIIFVHKIY